MAKVYYTLTTRSYACKVKDVHIGEVFRCKDSELNSVYMKTSLGCFLDLLTGEVVNILSFIDVRCVPAIIRIDEEVQND